MAKCQLGICDGDSKVDNVESGVVGRKAISRERHIRIPGGISVSIQPIPEAPNEINPLVSAKSGVLSPNRYKRRICAV